MTWAQLLCKGQEELEASGIEDAEWDAWYLLSHVTGIDRVHYLMRTNESIGQAAWLAEYERLLEKRKAHIPLQHLTGSQNFMGFDFIVSPDVLIPRQDTETLVEEVLSQLGRRTEEKTKILDLCTGSGCIAISLKKLCKNADVTASDISPAALAIAKRNAKEQAAEIDFYESDLLENIEGSFDVIVSNPPYIAAPVIETLMPEVRLYEPIGALDGGEDGLDFYRKITRKAPEYLRPGGWLFLEIGHDQAEAVTQLLLEQGFGNVQLKQDLAGCDRILFATTATIKKEQE